MYMSSIFNLIAQETDLDYRNTLFKLYQKEFNDLTSRKMKMILEQEFTLGYLGKMHEEMKGIIKSNAYKIKEKLAVEHNNGWVFITVNPKPEVKWDDFYKKITKLAKRKMWTHAVYAFEQRGKTESEAGKGFHVHMLCKRDLNYKPTHCKRNIRNGCKTLVKEVKTDRFVNIQIVGDDYKKDKLEYFTGIKTGEGKDAKQAIDIIWRKKLAINDVYEFEKKS